MKNIVKISIAAAAFAFALAACTDIENSTGGTGLKEGSDATPDPIALMPLTYTPTKAIVTGTSFPDTLSIHAAAYFNEDTGTTAGTKYFADIVFAKAQDSTKWFPKYTYYWPIQGTLSMYAITKNGKSDESEYNNVTVTFSDTDDKTFKIKVDKLEDDQDILVGAHRNAKKTSDAMTFFHIGSLIEVQMASSEDFTVQTGDNTDKMSGIAVTHVQIDTVKLNIPEFVLTRGDNNDSLSFTPTVSDVSAAGDSASRVIFPKASDTQDTLRLYKQTTKDMYIFGRSQDSLGQRVIVPAQKKTTMTIKYKLYNGNDGQASPELKCTVALPEIESQTDAKDKWLPGKKYTYKVTITLDKITIDPSVSDWDNTDKEVTVQSN